MANLHHACDYLREAARLGNPHAADMLPVMESFIFEMPNPVTDRALRYRANATPPPGPRQCCLCGSKTNVEVGHISGYEEDSEEANLFWTCRSCNVRSANTLRNAGIGRKTRQYNPASEGAQSMAQWVTAVSAMKGESEDMSVSDAVAMIRATSPEKRSRYAREIWSRRKKRHGSGGRSSEVPF